MSLCNTRYVTPAEAGVQTEAGLDAGLRRHDVKQVDALHSLSHRKRGRAEGLRHLNPCTTRWNPQ